VTRPYGSRNICSDSLLFIAVSSCPFDDVVLWQASMPCMACVSRSFTQGDPPWTNSAVISRQTSSSPRQSWYSRTIHVAHIDFKLERPMRGQYPLNTLGVCVQNLVGDLLNLSLERPLWCSDIPLRFLFPQLQYFLNLIVLLLDCRADEFLELSFAVSCTDGFGLLRGEKKVHELAVVRVGTGRIAEVLFDGADGGHGAVGGGDGIEVGRCVGHDNDGDDTQVWQ
jgi:hypothetical protein